MREDRGNADIWNGDWDEGHWILGSRLRNGEY